MLDFVWNGSVFSDFYAFTIIIFYKNTIHRIEIVF